MRDFWPSGVDLEDTASPVEILKEANAEWVEKTGGKFELLIQEATSKDHGVVVIVHARHSPSNRTATLFSVTHRPAAPYPARIWPKGDELPNTLKKTYYQAGWDALSSSFSRPGREVTNEWVADTPAEFRVHLKASDKSSVRHEICAAISGIDDNEVKETGDLSCRNASCLSNSWTFYSPCFRRTRRLGPRADGRRYAMASCCR